MTTPIRFEQDLPTILADVYLAGTPEYRDELVQQLARTSQRSAWTFPGRWLPMALVTERLSTPRAPWRALGAVALIALLIAALAAAYVGTRPHVPAPFGVARNGLVADDTGGDIRVIDPATGEARVVLGGPDRDILPIFTRDGRSIVFMRSSAAAGSQDLDGDLFVVSIDGGTPTRLTPTTTGSIDWMEIAPDSSGIAYVSKVNDRYVVSTASFDGASHRDYPIDMAADANVFYTTDGRSLVFLASNGPHHRGPALAAVDLESGVVRTVVEPPVGGTATNGYTVTPDGRSLIYGLETFNGEVRLHIVGLDGSGDELLIPSHLGSGEGWPLVSPSGRYVFYMHWSPGPGSAGMAIPAIFDRQTSTSVDIQTTIGSNGASMEWAPDESFVAATRTDDGGTALQQERWDTTTGVVTPTSWTTVAYPSIQRVAP